MTVNATLSQGNTSIDLPLLEESGEVLLSVDYGKPNLVTHDAGGFDFPRIQDQWSGSETYNLVGKFVGDSAYQDAIDLIDLIHDDGGGNPMQLSISALNELDDPIDVAPAAEQDRAVDLNYQPGRKNVVDFDLGLSRIETVQGTYDRTFSTPTGSGTGPIQIRGGGKTVDLETGVEVSRQAGRPNDVIRKNQATYPRYLIKRKPVNDEFELRFWNTSNAATLTKRIADIFREQTERSGITLDFQGIYGMGEFDVIPSGSGALRHVRESGKEGVTIIPTVQLQRIQV